jgi:DNA-binding IclR family transcriptional regulator
MASNKLTHKTSFTSSREADTEYHVPNLERALSILETLSISSEGLSISEAADRLNIPRNSAHRIMMTLLKHDYLSRNEDSKAFRLTKKMLVLGYGAFRDKNLVEYALGPMRELRDITHETVPLGVLYNTSGIVIEQVTGLHLFKYVLEPGKPFHLNTAAPAKAILAFLPEKEQENLMRRMEFKRFNQKTIATPKEYRTHLHQVKKQGYSIDMGEEYDGMHCLGAPVFDQHGYPVAAIWITGPSERIEKKDFERLGNLVKTYALKISNKLGFGLQNN